MKGRIAKNKGTLLELFLEFRSGKVLTIQPLQNDAALVIFSPLALKAINADVELSENEIVVVAHDGSVVAKYRYDSEIIAAESIVLYPDGKVWSGPVFTQYELKDLSYLVLTEESTQLLTTPGDVKFEADYSPQKPTFIAHYHKPTFIAQYAEGVELLCGWHQCNKCREADKFFRNDLTNEIV